MTGSASPIQVCDWPDTTPYLCNLRRSSMLSSKVLPDATGEKISGRALRGAPGSRSSPDTS